MQVTGLLVAQRSKFVKKKKKKNYYNHHHNVRRQPWFTSSYFLSASEATSVIDLSDSSSFDILSSSMFVLLTSALLALRDQLVPGRETKVGQVLVTQGH